MLHDSQERIDEYLTNAISSALADREEKIKQIQKWEKEVKLFEQLRRKKVRITALSSSAAACLIGLLMFINYNRFPMPEFDSDAYYRGENKVAIVDSMIKDRNYKKALTAADSLKIEYETELTEYSILDSLNEIQEYERLLLKLNLYDLEWRRINLMLQLKQRDSAVNLLETFIEKKGIYKEDAEKLYDRLKN